MVNSLLLGAAIAEGRVILEDLRRAEAMLQDPGNRYRARGLAELHKAIVKFDAGLQQATRIRP